MKTVGIMTYHRHYNYGTMLQAYALQQAIDNLGLNAEIIDFYQPNQLIGAKLALTRLKRLVDCEI